MSCQKKKISVGRLLITLQKKYFFKQMRKAYYENCNFGLFIYLYDIDYTAEYRRPTEINKSKKKTLNPKYSAYSLDGL